MNTTFVVIFRTRVPFDRSNTLGNNLDKYNFEIFTRMDIFLGGKFFKKFILGRDASALFPSIVKLVASSKPELKKLVYVYLERYAQEQQELALLSISTFQRGLKDHNQVAYCDLKHAEMAITSLQRNKNET